MSNVIILFISDQPSVMCELLNAGSGNPLEQFVLLAKNAKGAAAVELIKQALEVLRCWLVENIIGIVLFLQWY